MREIVIQMAGDNWNDEEEAENLCDEVATALDRADFAYLDVNIHG